MLWTSNFCRHFLTFSFHLRCVENGAADERVCRLQNSIMIFANSSSSYCFFLWHIQTTYINTKIMEKIWNSNQNHAHIFMRGKLSKSKTMSYNSRKTTLNLSQYFWKAIYLIEKNIRLEFSHNFLISILYFENSLNISKN